MSAAPETAGEARERKARGIRIVLLYLPVHVLVAALTWRDIGRRPADQMRGGKRAWRLASAVNTLGAVGYWLVGRGDT